jgi:hypothetical protein
MKTALFRRPVATILLLAATMISAVAQDYRGKLQGLVADSSEAVIVGASVTLTNTQTGVSTRRETNQTGHYLFDYVEPGIYSVAVEHQGFSRFIQRNITVQARADVTIDAVLRLGETKDSIVVSATQVAVEFNSSSITNTVDQKMATELPNVSRNPFLMATLDPAINTKAYFAVLPYVSWSASSLNAGGAGNNGNEVMVDGTPINLGPKASYTPPTDAVQEVVVQQNSVDASFGASAGATIQVVMKSGTNNWHGLAWFTGRNPALQAWSDRTVRTPNTTRQNMFGGSVGNPIVKNRLFNYFAYEQWKTSAPSSWVGSVPNSAERTGDFSASKNLDGSLRTIYDPWSSTFNSATGIGARQPFAGNAIPASSLDPVAVRFMKDIWASNNAGENITGINNFKSAVTARTNYYNFSERLDYVITEKLRVYGRVDRFHTLIDDTNPTPNNSPAFVGGDGSARHAFTTSIDGIYTINPTTILNLHGDYNSLVDGYVNPETQQGGYGAFWSNGWFKTYAADAPVYYPRLNIASTSFGQPWVYWYQDPRGQSYNAKLSKQMGRHYIKTGIDHRRQNGRSLSLTTGNFVFSKSMTADDFVVAHTNVSGDAYASFLLGAMDSNSTWYTSPYKEARWHFWSGFVQDDFKLSSRLTLNLGIRYELEMAPTDPLNRLGRYLDLTKPIPEMQANPPAIPAAVVPFRKAAPVYNGAYVFTDNSHTAMYDTPKTIFLPRVGLAYKINDKTAFRFGWARFALPFAKSSANSLLSLPYPGLDGSQTTTAPVLGVPQVTLADPFKNNDLVPPLGSQYGRYWGLGTSLTWTKPDYSPGVNDRINFSLQRQLPFQLLLDTTFFLNVGHDLPFRRDLNLADPNVYYTQKGAVALQVSNPFYQYGTTKTYPGSLRNTKTLSIYALTTPYPQYQSLYYLDNSGLERFKSLQLKLQRPFANGFNVLVGYNYNREKSSQYFNDIDQYADSRTYQWSSDPRHRLSIASVYEPPFGKGRKLLSVLPRAADALIGGWQLSAVLKYQSGDYLQTGSYQVSGNPAIGNPTPTRWFDTSRFSLNPAYTPRSNPWFYDGLTGPRYVNLDTTLSKKFMILEKLHAEVKLANYNATNRLNRANPDMSVTSSTFGQALRQNSFGSGRQTDIGLRIQF